MDGLVAPCCFDKGCHSINWADLKERSFKEIWENGEYKKFRTAILKGRRNIDICSNCSEGTKFGKVHRGELCIVILNKVKDAPKCNEGT
jgi:hypothetical protein